MKFLLKLSSCFLVGSFLMVSSLVAQDKPEVDVYGKIQASVNYISQDSADSGLHVSSHNTRWGIKGSVDVTDALTAMFQIEIATDITDNKKSSDDLFKARNTFIGIKGDAWGSLLIGRYDNPYKRAQMKSDIFNDTIADYDGIIGRSSDGKKAHIRANNIINYKTPKFLDGALSAALAIIPSDNVVKASDKKDENDAVNPDANDKLGVSANVVYNNKDMGISASLAVHYDSGGLSLSTADEDAFAVRLIGGYKFLEQHQVWLILENLDSSADNSATSRAAFNLGYVFTFSSFSTGESSIRANVSFALESDTVAGDDDATQFSIGFYQQFNKNFRMYALATYLAGGDNAAYSLGKSTDLYSLSGTTDAGDDTLFGFAIGSVFKF